MRTLALIGAILVLLLPFSVVWTTYNVFIDTVTVRESYGLLYYNVHSENNLVQGDDSKSFNSHNIIVPVSVLIQGILEQVMMMQCDLWD